MINISLVLSMRKKPYKNKITIMALIAGTIAAVAVTSSVSFFNYKAEATTPTTSTLVQVGGGNATWFFFGYNPQKVEIQAGATVVWNVPSSLTAEPHTVTFVFNNKTMTYRDAPFGVPTPTKFMPLPPSSNSQPIVIPGNNRGMNTVILVNGRVFNPTLIDYSGNVKLSAPNADFTISGKEQYVNSGWLLPKGNLPPGTSNTFSVTFEKAGTYNYLCILHPWMTGTVIVK
jgi:plastocyanin